MFKFRSDEMFKRTVIILFLVFWILSLPVIFVLCGGLQKVADFKGDKEADVSAVASQKASEAAAVVTDFVEEVIGTEGEVDTLTSVRIEDIVGISELQTLGYSYNAICRVYDSGELVYCVAYEGQVNLGIDASAISINYGSDFDKTITILLPPVQILDETVNAGTMEYIFYNNSYNNETTPQQAYIECQTDLANRAGDDANMFEYAKVNTEAEIRAFTEPLVEQFYPDYTLVIDWEE